MKKTLIAVAVILAIGSAHATKPTERPAPTPTPTATANGGSAKAKASARQTVIVNAAPATAAAAATSKTDNGTVGSAFGGAGGSVNGSGNGGASVNVESAPSAYAPGLAASNGTCMGSTSAGSGNSTLALSFGTTWADGDCNARYDAQILFALGQQRAALARLCQRPDNARALADAGMPCPSAEKRASGAPAAAAVAHLSDDPLIRQRQLRATAGN